MSPTIQFPPFVSRGKSTSTMIIFIMQLCDLTNIITLPTYIGGL